jgi:outer membrane protein
MAAPGSQYLKQNGPAARFKLLQRSKTVESAQIINEPKGNRTMGTIRGVKVALALAVLSVAASMSVYAQASGQAAAVPQAPPATPAAMPQPKRITTNLGRDFTLVKPMWSNPLLPYKWSPIPAPQFVNSPRLAQRIQNGKLLLTLQDAIELALENNTDILIQRYYPSIADLDLIRTAAGSNARGVGSVNPTALIGNNPATGSFDPALNTTVTFDSRHAPANNPLTAGTGTASSTLSTQFTHNTNTNVQYVQAFPTGTAISAGLNTIRASTTSSAQFYVPSVQTVGSLSVTQQLLNGWGLALNKRAIRIARIARKGSDLAFAQSVLTDITSVQNFYWELVFARGDVDVQRRSVELAQRLYDDNQRQVQIGTLAPLELVRAEAQLATAQQNLINAQTRQMQQQNSLLNVIVKDLVDPTLVSIEVVPVDSAQATPPVVENLPVSEAVREAMTKRPDVQLSKLNLTAHDVNLETVKSALLPTLSANAFVSGTGLSGNTRKTPVITGGFPDALKTVFTGDFPDYQATFTLNIPLRNRPAQADVARALLVQQQDQARLLQLQNTVAVDVQNSQIALKQSRTAVEAAVKTRVLQEQTLAAEQTRFQLGASTIFLVVQAQRDLSTAASAEVRAQVNLMEATASFERAMGRTLESNRIEISDAKSTASVPTYAQIPGTSVTGQLIDRNTTQDRR